MAMLNNQRVLKICMVAHSVAKNTRIPSHVTYNNSRKPTNPLYHPINDRVFLVAPSYVKPVGFQRK